MIITKNFQTTIDLLNSSEIYNVNKNNIILQKLNERYKNICYQSSLIIEITKIIRQSSIRMIDNRLDGGATIDVMFEAKCLILNIGEVICGVQIFKMNNNMITANHENIAIIIKKNNNKITKVIQIDQNIPVIITGIKYNIGNNKISASAYPLSPDLLINETIYFNITEKMNEKEKEKIFIIIGDINNIKSEINNCEPQIINLFQTLLYPYKNKTDINKKYNKKITNLPLLNMEKLLEIKNGCILYPSEYDKSEEKIFYINDEHEMKENEIASNVIYNTCYNIVSYILNDYLYYLLALKELVKYYSTIDKIKTISNYWKIYNENKL
jgi:hypothetical protein